MNTQRVPASQVQRGSAIVTVDHARDMDVIVHVERVIRNPHTGQVSMMGHIDGVNAVVEVGPSGMVRIPA